MDEKKLAILEKVQKLFALSESPNEHEAALAAAKAQEILDKENLTLFDLKRLSASDIDSYFVDEGIRHAAWASHLFVKLSHAYDLRPYHSRGCLKVVGYKQDVDVFQYIHFYLKLVIKILAHKENMKAKQDEDNWNRTKTARFKKAFCFGASDRICHIITEERSKRLSRNVKCTALVVQKKHQIRKWINQNLNLKDRHTPKSSLDNNAYNKGIEAANSIPLRDGISGDFRLITA